MNLPTIESVPVRWFLNNTSYSREHHLPVWEGTVVAPDGCTAPEGLSLELPVQVNDISRYTSSCEFDTSDDIPKWILHHKWTLVNGTVVTHDDYYPDSIDIETIMLAHIDSTNPNTLGLLFQVTHKPDSTSLRCPNTEWFESVLITDLTDLKPQLNSLLVDGSWIDDPNGSAIYQTNEILVGGNTPTQLKWVKCRPFTTGDSIDKGHNHTAIRLSNSGIISTEVALQMFKGEE